MNLTRHDESGNARAGADASAVLGAAVAEAMEVQGKYTVRCFAPTDADKPEFIRLRALTESLRLSGAYAEADATWAEAEKLLTILKWEDEFSNLVTTVGKNEILDKSMAGSGYTATLYMAPVSSVSFTAYAAADTMGSHGGWTEAGPTNVPNYSQANRPTMAFSAASAGSKVTSSAIVFSITSGGTIKGCFVTTVNTKDGTTGILWSAGNFTGGDKVVVNTDTLNVTYTLSV